MNRFLAGAAAALLVQGFPTGAAAQPRVNKPAPRPENTAAPAASADTSATGSEGGNKAVEKEPDNGTSSIDGGEQDGTDTAGTKAGIAPGKVPATIPTADEVFEKARHLLGADGLDSGCGNNPACRQAVLHLLLQGRSDLTGGPRACAADRRSCNPATGAELLAFDESLDKIAKLRSGGSYWWPMVIVVLILAIGLLLVVGLKRLPGGSIVSRIAGRGSGGGGAIPMESRSDGIVERARTEDWNGEEGVAARAAGLSSSAPARETSEAPPEMDVEALATRVSLLVTTHIRSELDKLEVSKKTDLVPAVPQVTDDVASADNRHILEAIERIEAALAERGPLKPGVAPPPLGEELRELTRTVGDLRNRLEELAFHPEEKKADAPPVRAPGSEPPPPAASSALPQASAPAAAAPPPELSSTQEERVPAPREALSFQSADEAEERPEAFVDQSPAENPAAPMASAAASDEENESRREAAADRAIAAFFDDLSRRCSPDIVNRLKRDFEASSGSGGPKDRVIAIFKAAHDLALNEQVTFSWAPFTHLVAEADLDLGLTMDVKSVRDGARPGSVDARNAVSSTQTVAQMHSPGLKSSDGILLVKPVIDWSSH